MKYILSFNESINLGLSKQSRKVQKKKDINSKLDEIFGKNIYRLYYDLNTNKQIYPNKKLPLLNLDINVEEKLKDDISKFLQKYGYTLIDFDRNLCNKNKQNIKITKVLKDSDNHLLNQYTSYLDNITKNTKEDKLYVVISRHSHDILNMGSHPNFKTCEDLTDTINLKETNFGKGDYEVGDGEGSRAYSMIKDGDLIFYLIKEGDWNIKDPIGRFASGVYCEQETHGYYGDYSEKFKNFIREWLPKYRSIILKKYDIFYDKELFNKNKHDILRLLQNNSYNSTIFVYLIKGIFENDRMDVIEHIMNMDYQNKIFYIRKIDEIFGYKFIKSLPENIKTIIYETLKTQFNSEYVKINNLYDILFNEYNKTGSFKVATKLAEQHMFSDYKSFYDFMKSFNIFDNDLELTKLCKITEPVKYEQANNMLTKINKLNYREANKIIDAKLRLIYDTVYKNNI